MSHPYSRQALISGTKKFLSGKVISALLTLGILLVTVRLLPVTEYGAYVTLLAMTEIGRSLAQLGLAWLTARQLPEYRLKADGPRLIRFCRRVAVWQSAALIACALLFAVLMDAYLNWAGLQAFRPAAWVFLGVFLVEGVGRFLREAVLGPLLLQGGIRASMVGRQLLYLVALLVLWRLSGSDLTQLSLFPLAQTLAQPGGGLYAVVLIELIASVFGTLIAMACLFRFCRSMRGLQGEAGWTEPSIREQWWLSLHMYFAHLLTLLYSPQALVNLLQKYLGPEASAVFGFLRTLNDQIARYLPASLLFSLIRPKLVAVYVNGGGTSELSRLTNSAGKVSLVILLPLVSVAAVFGDDLIHLISGGKFSDSGYLFFGFLLCLIPYSQRLLLETAAVTLDQANLCKWGAALGLITLPSLWGLLHLGFGVWAAVIAIGLGHVLFNTFIIAGLKRRCDYAFDWLNQTKLILAMAVAIIPGAIGPDVSVAVIGAGLIPLLGYSLLIVGAFAVSVLLLRPFTAEETGLLKSLVKRGASTA
ncbi:hypothetical protein HCH_03422 [Hahella chejuensis KCTC 2396]|uniref:Membrane protein involved in the export of O-antigen and teichoic acid n=1 Tax=Hahella chejuensis (strain KCTC 2396) TaxID=349521 RepID=Q2SGQ4_HAHCH|nr:oligosaccharide flippase family protein [Hahella chejuensis]ABC30170.1 hypothetical protein HCH_03422 [Hahella chejuensis KCTC 2396]